jgi:hypothetical protein
LALTAIQAASSAAAIAANCERFAVRHSGFKKSWLRVSPGGIGRIPFFFNQLNCHGKIRARINANLVIGVLREAREAEPVAGFFP